MVADENKVFHHLWIRCTPLLVNHIVAQVTGLPEEVVWEAYPKEQAKKDTKFNSVVYQIFCVKTTFKHHMFLLLEYY